MTDVVQAILLGALQGVTELFPISSLGHTVVLPTLLGWGVNQSDPSFLAFLIATHFATAVVLLGFYATTWIRIVRAMVRSLAAREVRADDPDGRLGWLLVVATVPAGLAGLLLQDQIRELFASARVAAFFLICNGAMLFGAEVLRRRALTGDRGTASQLSWPRAFGVGSAQALALIPGFSRTGATMSGSLLAGLSHPEAARFAFLLATPIIFAAAALKLPEVATHTTAPTFVPTIAGMISSGAFAYISVRYLVRYFRVNTLTPFAIYCVLFGALASVLLLRG